MPSGFSEVIKGSFWGRCDGRYKVRRQHPRQRPAPVQLIIDVLGFSPASWRGHYRLQGGVRSASPPWRRTASASRLRARARACSVSLVAARSSEPLWAASAAIRGSASSCSPSALKFHPTRRPDRVAVADARRPPASTLTVQDRARASRRTASPRFCRPSAGLARARGRRGRHRARAAHRAEPGSPLPRPLPAAV